MAGVRITSIPYLECENANINCDESRMRGSRSNLPERPQSRMHANPAPARILRCVWIFPERFQIAKILVAAGRAFVAHEIITSKEGYFEQSDLMHDTFPPCVIKTQACHIRQDVDPTRCEPDLHYALGYLQIRWRHAKCGCRRAEIG